MILRDASESIIRSSATAWLEMRSAIRDDQRQVITSPELRTNWMQRQEERILQWKERNGYMGRLIKLKGRRQGSSTGTIAQLAHRLRARPTASIVCGLDYGKNVKAMEEMLWFMIRKDRFNWGVTGHQLIGRGGHFSNGSKLTLVTANNPDTGKGDGAQFILMTEAAYYPVSEKRAQSDLTRSLYQLVPRTPGTVIVVESTPKGEGGEFHDTWLNAITFEHLQRIHAGLAEKPKNWNHFVKLFYPWHAHPDYVLPVSPHEAEVIMETLSDREREMVHEFQLGPERLAWRRMVLAGADFKNDEDKFEVEYPSDEYRCFAGSGRKVFYWRSVSAIRKRTLPGEIGVLDLSEDKRIATFRPCPAEEGAWMRRWEIPRQGDRHLIVVDTMTGDQAGSDTPDNHAPLVLRSGFYDGTRSTTGQWCPPKVVARLTDVWGEEHAKRMHQVCCTWDVDFLIHRVWLASLAYAGCLVVVEQNNDPGLIKGLREKGVQLYQREEMVDKILQTVATRYGWKTTPQNRPMIIAALQAAVRDWRAEGGGIDVPDIRMAEELAKFIIKANGRSEAGAGAKDDTVMALAIGLSLIGKATPYVPREFFARGDGLEDDEPRGYLGSVDGSWG